VVVVVGAGGDVVGVVVGVGPGDGFGGALVVVVGLGGDAFGVVPGTVVEETPAGTVDVVDVGEEVEPGVALPGGAAPAAAVTGAPAGAADDAGKVPRLSGAGLE
jgi:hypothetical protein